MKTKVILSALLIGVIFTFFNSCILYYTNVDGNGKVVSQERKVSKFDSVTLDGVGDVYIYFDENPKVVVVTDSNIQEYIKVNVRGYNLCIDTTNNIGFDPTELKINVYMPELKNARLRGVGDIEIAKGKASDLDLSLSGVGNIYAQNYEVENVSVSLSGVGDIRTWATRELSGRLSGVGNVMYKGNPKISVTTNITGNVKKM